MPVWMLLTPRAYLSTYMKIGTILLPRARRHHRQPDARRRRRSRSSSAAAARSFPGPLFPFVFITIACGAISGFHALIASGTTSKMVDKETDIRPVGYVAMLFEGLVGVMALIAASALHPGDYFAINVAPAVFANARTCPIVNLMDLQAQVGENVIGRTGGAVSLAVGMAQIFSNIPGMRGLMAYWYHFAIMFEALFILTTIDSGTRVGRFLLQEFGRPRLEEVRRHQLAAERAGLVRHHGAAVGLLHLDRQHRHDLAAVRRRQPAARVGRARRRHDDPDQHGPREVRVGHAHAALLPRRSSTLYGGFLNIRDNYWPKAIGADPALHVQGYVDSICTVDHDGLRGHHPRRRRAPLAARAVSGKVATSANLAEA